MYAASGWGNRWAIVYVAIELVIGWERVLEIAYVVIELVIGWVIGWAFGWLGRMLGARMRALGSTFRTAHGKGHRWGMA